MWAMMLAIGCSAAGPLHVSGRVESRADGAECLVEARAIVDDLPVLATVSVDVAGRFDLVVEEPAAGAAPPGKTYAATLVAWADVDRDGARGAGDVPIGVLDDPMLFYVAAADDPLVPQGTRVGWNVGKRVVGKPPALSSASGVVDVVIPANLDPEADPAHSLRVRVREAGTGWCAGVEAPRYEDGHAAGSGLVASGPLSPTGRAVLDLPVEPTWPGFPLDRVDMTYGRLVVWQAEDCGHYDPLEQAGTTYAEPLVVYARAPDAESVWTSVFPYSAAPNRWALQGRDRQPPLREEITLDAP